MWLWVTAEIGFAGALQHVCMRAVRIEVRGEVEYIDRIEAERLELLQAEPAVDDLGHLRAPANSIVPNSPLATSIVARRAIWIARPMSLWTGAFIPTPSTY